MTQEGKEQMRKIMKFLADPKRDLAKTSYQELEKLCDGDCVLAGMIKDGVPLTRDNYIASNFIDGQDGYDLESEEESEMPPMFCKN